MFYQTYPDSSVDAYLYAQFLRRLIGAIRGPIVLLHDRGKIHEGEWFEELVDDFPWLQVEQFPPYAPELNPVEPLWNYTKDEQLANFPPATVGQLDTRLHEELQIITATKHDSNLSSRPRIFRGKIVPKLMRVSIAAALGAARPWMYLSRLPPQTRMFN